MDNNQGFITENNCSLKLTVRSDSIADAYTVETRPFARGKFATVRRCRHRESGKEYAAKYIRKRRRTSDVRHEILHEAYVLKMCEDCPRIVKLHEVFETPSEIILVLEMAAGGELQYLLDNEEALPEKDVMRLMRQILDGVRFLHEKNIAHLDLKPQNLLLTSAYPQGDVKLCDFGISRRIFNGVDIREINGTPDYVAPEVLQFEPISLSTDMWSVGILAYVLLSGHSPFGGDTKQETFCNITNGSLDFPKSIFKNVSNAAKDFMCRLIVRDAKKRLTASESLKHPWLQQDNCIPLPPLETVTDVQHSTLSSAVSSSSSESEDNEDPNIANKENGIIDKVPTPIPIKVVLNGTVTPTESSEETDTQKETLTKEAPPAENGILVQNGHEKNDSNSLASHKLSQRVHKSTSASIERHNVRNVADMESIVVDGLSISSKRLMFAEELIVDERVGIVY